MQIDEKEEGKVEASNPVVEEVIAQEEEIQSEEEGGIDATKEGEVIVEETQEFYDKDEEALGKLLEAGKEYITTEDLIKADVDQDRIKPFGFQIGRYRCTRTLLLSPYKLEKID